MDIITSSFRIRNQLCLIASDRRLRYTAPGGKIAVSITQQAQGMCVAIDKPGTDIPAAQLARLFERFYRAETSRHTIEGDGTGLGLAITQAIIHAHRGSISASSEGGHTCFAIWLPQAA